MTRRTLLVFFILSFGISWGLLALFGLFTAQVEAAFGKPGYTNPLFILAVHAPALSALGLVVHHHGLAGLGPFQRRLLPWRMPWGWWLLLIVGPALVSCSGAAIKGTIGAPFPVDPGWTLLPALLTTLAIGPPPPAGVASVMSLYPCSSVKRFALVLAFGVGACAASARAAESDTATLEHIDRFVESERQASGIPGIALAIVHEGRLHVRGFGSDGRGHAISGDTPFPIGSLTKSFTALLVRQAIDAGQLDAEAPVQRYLPWFRVADAAASQRITLRHLLNQTSGFSRADGIAPLLTGSRASIDELSRGLARVRLNRPVGERYEYSNLNYVLLGAVLQAATGRSWRDLVQERVLQPLAMTHSHADHAAARRDGMTAVHQIVFGVPLAQEVELLPAFEPTGALVASAHDMARYLQMLLAEGAAPSGRVVSAAGVRQLMAPASPPGHSTLLAADFDFRYGEGWFVGPFGAAPDARWHLGSLTPFAAWMVLLPDTRQAVVVLINANTELPLGDVSAVMSRLPIGVVNLLRGQAPPSGPSLRAAYGRVGAVAVGVLVALGVLAWWAARARRSSGAGAMAFGALALPAAAAAAGLGPSLLWVFAPELAIMLAFMIIVLVAPLAWRLARPGRRRA